MDSTEPERLDHVAGSLCLELANTIPSRSVVTDRDWLIAPGVEAWSRSVGLPTTGGTQQKERDDLIALRDAVYSTFAPVARQETAPADAVDTLTSLHARGLIDFGYEVTAGAVSRRWPVGEGHAARVARIATSAIDLLTGPQLDRVRECPGCGWLFIDASRNRSRRWCSMETCGNRSKARRHQSRARVSTPTTPSPG